MIEVRDGKSVFSLRAGGILLRSDWVLLQNADAGYILPGGRIELLETAERALAREMWEELRVHVDVIGPGCVFQEIFDYEGQHVHQVLFCFEMHTFEDFMTEKLDAQGMSWLRIHSLEGRQLYPHGIKDEIMRLLACRRLNRVK
jgi:ADP-ribose pyrophosphatase YjhB (NUDIX family)